jgi:hypothetical protein
MCDGLEWLFLPVPAASPARQKSLRNLTQLLRRRSLPARANSVRAFVVADGFAVRLLLGEKPNVRDAGQRNRASTDNTSLCRSTARDIDDRARDELSLIRKQPKDRRRYVSWNCDPTKRRGRDGVLQEGRLLGQQFRAKAGID